jgi:post-GPI attachment to proteins factor 2
MDISQMEFFQVYNLIPSISSITGISPQRYLWRCVIALHIWPRFLLSFVHKNYLKRHVLSKITDQAQMMQASRLVQIVHWLNLIEICALGGVTYISNRENYRELQGAFPSRRENADFLNAFPVR